MSHQKLQVEESYELKILYGTSLGDMDTQAFDRCSRKPKVPSRFGIDDKMWSIVGIYLCLLVVRLTKALSIAFFVKKRVRNGASFRIPWSSSRSTNLSPHRIGRVGYGILYWNTFQFRIIMSRILSSGFSTIGHSPTKRYSKVSPRPQPDTRFSRDTDSN